MPRPQITRKARFQAALALAGLTAEQWAEKRGITGGHLSNVLNEKRESASLLDDVDRFIAEHLDKHSAAVA